MPHVAELTVSRRKMKMNRTRFLGLVVAGLSLTTRASHAEERNKAISLTDALDIKEFIFVTIIHSPKGSQEARIASYVTNRAKLSSLRKYLSEFPSRGGVFERLPKDGDHWMIYIHDKDKKIAALELYQGLLQSPVDRSFVSNAKDPSNSELMKVLIDMLQTGEDG